MSEVIHNGYGFVWGDDILVERTCSNQKPKFYVLRVYDMMGTCIEIVMRPRSTKITKHKRPRSR
jgi:hypothetical protein